MTDAIISGAAYNSVIRAFLACNHPEKGCFSMAVSADKPDTFTFVYPQAGIIEEHMSAVAFV
jgi:hypothetical protein